MCRELSVPCWQAWRLWQGVVITAVLLSGLGAWQDDALVLTVTGESAQEANGPLTFTLTLDAPSTSDIELTYATADVTATAGVDYEGEAAGSFTIKAGTRDTTIAVQMKHDGRDEPDETFKLTVAAVNAGDIGSGSVLSAVGKILDNDAAPVLRVTGQSKEEGNGPLTFTLTLDAVSGRDIELTYATADVTATAGADYVEVPAGSFTIKAGTRDTTIAVQMKHDGRDEEDETFELTVTAVIASDIRSGSVLSAVGTIRDNDAAPVLRVTGQSKAEANGPLTFKLTLDAVSGRDIELTYATADVTATAGADYAGVAVGRLTIEAGASDRTVTVQMKHDALDEEDETFELRVAAVNAGEIGSGSVLSAVGTIRDNDAAPVLRVTGQSKAEANGPLTFKLTLDAVSGRDIELTYATVDVTATAGADYAGAAAGTFTIEEGTRETTLAVQMKHDAIDEEDETFKLTMAAVDASEIGSGSVLTAVGTIRDNDAAPLLRVTGKSEEETNGPLTFTLTLDAVSGRDIELTYATADITAMAGLDYVGVAAGSFTIEAGTRETTLAVQMKADDLVEEDETFELTMTAVDAEKIGARSVLTAVGTIRDRPTVTLSVTPGAMAEGDLVADLLVTATLSAARTVPTIITLSFGGTATFGSDYEVVPASPEITVALAATSKEVAIALTVVDDTFYENIGSDAFEIIVVQGSNADGLQVESAELKLNDNDTVFPSIELTVEPSYLALDEGESGTLSFSLVLQGENPNRFEIDTEFTGSVVQIGELEHGEDYTTDPEDWLPMILPAGAISFAKDVTFHVIDDEIRETQYESLTLLHMELVANDVRIPVSRAGHNTTILSVSPSDEKHIQIEFEPTEAIYENAGPTDIELFVVPDVGKDPPDEDLRILFSVDERSSGAHSPEDYSIVPEVIPRVDWTQGESESDRVTITVTPVADDDHDEEYIERIQIKGVFTKGSGYEIRSAALRIINVAPPDLRGVGIESPPNHAIIYFLGEELTARINFSQPVGLRGQGMTFTVDLDSGPVVANCLPNANSSVRITCTYTIQAGDSDIDGVEIKAGAIKLGDASIVDKEGSSVTIDFTIPDTFLKRYDQQVQGTSFVYELVPSVESFQEGQKAREVVVTATEKLGKVSEFNATIELFFRNEKTSKQDYVVTGERTINIVAGETTGSTTLEITPTFDGIKEADEEVFYLDGDAGHQAVEPYEMKILDAPDISLAVSPESIQEDGGAETVTITASLPRIALAYDEAIVVELLQAGTATKGSDFTIGSLPDVTISAGETSGSGSVVVTPINDDLVEGDETISFNGATTSLGVTGTNLKLQDDDSEAGIILSVGNSLVGEADGETVIEVTATATATFSLDVDVSLDLGGQATEDTDYTADWDPGATISIAQGTTTGTTNLEISPVDDDIREGDETIVVQGTASNGVSVEVAPITLSDNDRVFELGIEAILQVAEGTGDETGSNYGYTEITVSLSPPPTRTVSVPVSYIAGTATAGGPLAWQDPYNTEADFAGFGEGVSLTFKPEIHPTQSFRLRMVPDRRDEDDETFTLVVQIPGQPQATTRATFTILDDDDPPVISIVEDAAGSEDVGQLVFLVRLDVESDRRIRVPYDVVDVTATELLDYTAEGNGELEFEPGETEQTITVRIEDDLLAEDDETFTVVLKESETVTLGDSEATGTIEDNDGAPEVIVENARGEEAAGSIRFFVRPIQESGRDISVDYTATTEAGNTATEGEDYVAVTQPVTLTIPAGSRGEWFAVTITDDFVDEDDETFTVTLSNPENASVGSATATGTILDDEDLSLRIDPAQASEIAGEIIFAVTMNWPSTKTIKVQAKTLDGADDTATEDVDYDKTSELLTILPLELAQSFVVTINNDLLEEADETFTVVLSNEENVSLSAAEATGTILDDEEAPVLTVAGESKEEADGPLTFTLTLDAESARDIELTYATADVTATAQLDYVEPVAGSITIEAGDQAATIAVQMKEDELDEQDETFELTVAAVDADAIGPRSVLTAVGTIEDDDEVPEVSIANADPVTEGDIAEFTLTLSAQSGRDVTVSYGTEDGSAVAPGDYEAKRGRVTIPAGKTEAVIVVRTEDDDQDEVDTETFTVVLSSAVNATLDADKDEGTGTILDNEGRPTVSIEDAPSVTEGVDAVFAVKLSEASAQEVSVSYKTVDVTATGGQDYDAAVGGSLVVPAGNTEATIVVGTSDDLLDENTETFTVILSAPVNSVLNADKDEGTGTILDNDDAPMVSIEDAPSVTEGGEAVFVVKLSEASASEVTVPYATSDATATAGQDYEAAVGGSLVIPAGKTDTTIVVGTIDDPLDEETETFTVVLGAPANATLDADKGEGTGTIEDNDDAPTVSIEDADPVTEGRAAEFTVTLSEVSGRDVVVPYVTSDGTANSPGDYVAEPSGSVKIKAGETEVTIEVHTIDDVQQEEEETFAVTLSDPVGAALAVGGEAATGTILDNDGAPTVSIEDAPPVTEGGKAEFVVRLSVASGQEVTVPYATSDATATAGADYEAETAGSLTIEAGRTDTTIVLQTLDDDLIEESETFTVTLGEPVGAELAVGGEDGTGTILDNDDGPTVSIEDAPPVTEGGEAVFAVTLSGVSGRQVVVAYATGDGTATGGQDYDAAVGGSLVIPAGKTDTTIAVQTIDDAEKEEAETFEVLLGDVQGATIEEGRGVAEGTIVDNEEVSVRIADAEAVIEGGKAAFAVTLSKASGQAVVLAYATRDVTAISPGDYAAEPNGSMTIEAGKTDTTIVVQTIDDTEKEEEETFEVVLTSAAGAGIVVGRSVGRGTIRDNDTARTVRIADAEVVTEGEVATFVLTLSGASSQAVVVGYATEDVTATSPGDYVAEPNGSVTIAVAETEVVIEVQTTDDTEREDRETFVVRLGDVAGATIGQGSGVAEGSIEDNEGISVRIADVWVAEGAGVAAFVVTLSAESDAEVTVAYATVDGSAEAGLDYSSRSGTLTFAVGDTEKEIRVSITDDALDEEDETFEVRLSAPVGAVLSDVVATGTILDNEPSLRIDDVTVAEAAGEAVFKVTLSPQSNWEVTLAYATADGSAEAGLDYSLDSGTLTFAVGDTEKEIRIPITDDTLDEEAETFTVTLTNPTSAGVTRPVATGTIEDDDAAPSLIVEDLEVFEHEGTASISVLLTSESQETVVVRYLTEDVTATTALEDYLSSAGTLEFAPGQSLGQIEVGILEDGHVEGDETFRVFLREAVHAGIADGEAVVTIRDNDVWSELRIGDAIAAEGGGTATFAVSLTPAAVEMVTVGYATADGSAEAGLDYTSDSGTLTFSAAETRKTFTVDVLEDTEVEQNETFTVELSDVLGARIALGIGVGTILDNDGTSILTVADMEVGEEVGTARVRVVLSPARGEEVTVAYATSDGTARQGEDYTAVTNTLSIPIGGEEGWIPIEITNDGIAEPDEAFTVTLSAPTHAILGNETATVAIVDDDLPVLSINNPFAPEHQGIMVFMLSLDQVRDEAVTVNYATMDVSATAGADYVSHAGIARIAAGALRQEIEVVIIEDAALESSETFEMVLSDARGAEMGVAVGRGTIQDNDAYNMAIRDVEVEEDEGSAVFTVELDYRNTDQEVSVSYRTLAGTAEDNEDFHGESGRLVFAPGALRRQIQVSIIDDAEHEADEAFSVVLSQVENATLVDAEATATIRDNDLRKVDITGVTVVEGEGVARFAVNLDDATLKPVILVYQTLEGTAESGSDYHSIRGALTFERGEIAKVIEVPVVDDGMDEPDETFTVLIGGALNAELMRSVATATILDDDEAPVLDVAGDVTVGEGDAAAVFTVTLRGRSAWPVEVEYETEDITAREGLDYTSSSGRLSIPPGFGTGTLTVVVLEDEVDEPDEAFLLRLTGAERATLGSAQARGIIMDNDATPALRIDDVTVVESEASAVFTVGMSHASSERVLVNYATSDETATAGLDYVNTNGTLVLEPGEVEAQIPVPVESDGVDELDAETFLVTLSVAVAAEIADEEGRGTILDDDDPVSLSIFDVTVAEDAGMANFVVRMSQVSGKFVNVNFATSDETAQQGSDYTASNGIIVFEPGSQTGKIAVSIVDDVLDESAEETFKATLSNASNAVIARGEATGTILDNEGQPLLRIDDVTVSEEDGVASFRVWLSEPSSRMVMVGYRTVDGSAEAGADYEGQQGTVSFEPGQIEETIAVKLIRDGRDWATETFTLALESATHAQIEDPAATATIVEEGSVLGDVMAQWLARFSRTSAGHVASALEDRVQWLTSAPRCTPRMGSGIKHFRYINPSWDPSVGELFSGCSMALKSARGQGEMSLWGRGAYTRFNGRDGQLSIKGNVSTAALGVDYLSPRGWLTGVLLAHSRGDGTFAAVDLEGEARSSLTGIYPYVRYGNTRRSVWGMAGYGTGTALLESEDSLESALDAVMGLAGMRVGLLKMGQAHVSYEADALVVRTMADNLDVLVHRVRAGLEGVLRLSQGWSPYVEASVRQDGGDAETGIGVEVAGGVRYAGNALKAEVTSRGLLAHASTGFTEWGVAGALHYGNAAGLGPAASIRPSWGTAHSGGMQALWRPASIEDALHGISGARRLELALGYGMPSIVGTGIARPVAAMTLQEQGREYRLGYEVAMRRYLNLSMEAVARTVAVNKRNYGVSVRGTMRW